MCPPYLVPLEASGDRLLCGGKAAGLAALLRHGFPVPPGVCVTTQTYFDTLQAANLNPTEVWARANKAPVSARERILEENHAHIAALTIAPQILEPLASALLRIGQAFACRPEVLWAVRSSATNEDNADSTSAGLFRTMLGVSLVDIPAAVTACWASLWTPKAWTYRARENLLNDAPAMAVVIQPLLTPSAAGVAYSHHPVTGQSGRVVINAVLGLAEPMVGGSIEPDCYIIDTESEPARMRERSIARKYTARQTAAGVVCDLAVPTPEQQCPSLTDEEALALARLIQQVERLMNHPVDVEWAVEEERIWLLQARAIPKPVPKPACGTGTGVMCDWSRANFKETLPDVPSPLGLSFLQEFMEKNIVRPYLRLGCSLPAGVSSIRILYGRPYINVTLFQSFMAQLGGDPALVTEHMGGQAASPPGSVRLPWWMLLRAAVMMEWKIRQAARRAPRWFAEMKDMADKQRDQAADCASPVELLSRLDRLGERLSSQDVTFAIVAGVSQGFYALQRLLERRVGTSSRSLLNAALQGAGTVVSARQIQWLAECADIAREEPAAAEFFHADPWQPERFRDAVAGTRFLQAFDRYLAEYGHRAVGESDVMSPRFSEVPDDVLGIIRRHVIAAALSMPEVGTKHLNARESALQRIRAALGWRYHEWWYVLWWHARLTRFLALREANRHHLMYATAALRQLLLMLGGQFAASGVLNRQEDIFFLDNDDIRALISGKSEEAISLVASRRAEYGRNATRTAPDFIMGDGSAVESTGSMRGSPGHVLSALSLSAGLVSGPVRLVRSQKDFHNVRRGDIVVTPVIDPGMVPLFGLAAGLIAEMGGILSHGAIIAREYGIPAVANIPGITRLLQDGQHIIVDADTGLVIISSEHR